MQRMNNVYLYLALWGCLLLVCAGCQNEMEEWDVQAQHVTVEMCVAQGKMDVRATPTDAEAAISSLRVFAFSGDKCVGHIRREATQAGTPFYMDLQLPAAGIHNVDFYVVANEGDMINENEAVALSETMTKADLQAVKFAALTQSGRLPMYCVQTEAINVEAVNPAYNLEDGHVGHAVLTQKVAFDLRRPMAKLSVYAAKVSGATANPQIHQVELLSPGTRLYNYLFPQTDDVLNAIGSRSNNYPLQSSVVTVSRELATGARPTDIAASYDVVCQGQYCWETAVGASAWNVPSMKMGAPVLHVEYALAAGESLRHAYINLPKIQRNHHMKVCILINSEGEVVVNYEVADWDDFPLPNYHFEYPTHSYLRESVPATAAEANALPSAPAVMRDAAPFVGYFQMTKPLTDAWTPTLLGLNASRCDIVVYDDVAGTEVTTRPIPASDKWYRIEVYPRSGMTAGDEVALAISYTATGLSESEFLLINGSNNSYYWPYTGSSQQDANYVVITMVN